MKNQTNLQTVLPQIEQLIAVGAAKELYFSEDQYREGLFKLMANFSWSLDLASDGLVNLTLIDYRLSEAYLAQAGKVTLEYKPSSYRHPSGEGIGIIQWGMTHKDEQAFVRYASGKIKFAPDFQEREGVVKEVLAAYLLAPEKFEAGDLWIPGCFDSETDPSQMLEIFVHSDKTTKISYEWDSNGTISTHGSFTCALRAWSKIE